MVTDVSKQKVVSKSNRFTVNKLATKKPNFLEAWLFLTLILIAET